MEWESILEGKCLKFEVPKVTKVKVKIMRDLSQYDGFRSQIKTGDLVEFASTGFIGKSIMKVTGRTASHSSIVIRMPYENSPRRYIIEAVRTGVELNLLSDVLQHCEGTCTWYGLKPEYDHLRDRLGEFAIHELARHKKYDFVSILAQLLGRVRLDAERLYCTELCELDYIDAEMIQPDPTGARRPGDLPATGIFVSQAHLWGEQD
jgi:hypothetical protein